MDNQALAAALQTALHLDRPPVGLAFVAEAPADLTRPATPAPSACTFWQRAEQGVFYADAVDHTECPIGMLTMGFPLDEAGQGQAMETVGMFARLEYFSPDEVAHLPSVTTPHQGIVYGPLAELPVPAEVVLLVASPFDAMLVAESGGSLALEEVPQLVAMGRPACAAIPRALNSGQTTLSLGCIGARTYAEIPDDRAVVVVPAHRVEPTVARLQTIAQANATLGEMHRTKKASM
jgi:uncharacterized protein (DUF169 family)